MSGLSMFDDVGGECCDCEGEGPGEPCPGLLVTVLGCDELPAIGATVTLTPSGGGTPTSGTTDSSGQVTLPYYPTGNHTIAVGYFGHSQVVNLTDCDPDPVTIDLVGDEDWVCDPDGCCSPYPLPTSFTVTDPQGSATLIWRPLENTWRSDTIYRTTCDGRVWNTTGPFQPQCAQLGGPTRYPLPGAYNNFTHAGSFPCYMEGSPCGVRLIWRGACNQASSTGTVWPWFSDAADFTNPLPSSLWQWRNIIGTSSSDWTRSVWECLPLLKSNTYGASLSWNACSVWDQNIGAGWAEKWQNWLYGVGPHTFTLSA